MEKRSPLQPRNAVAMLLLLFIFLTNDSEHQVTAQVFCRSQFTLANEACSLKIYPGVNSLTPLQRNESAAGDYALQESHGHSRHRHRHSHHLDGDPYDTACCRRLMGIDNSCICQVIARLPVFMTRVKHVLKLTPIPGCDVSFECTASY